MVVEEADSNVRRHLQRAMAIYWPYSTFVPRLRMLAGWGWWGYGALILVALLVTSTTQWLFLRRQLGSVDLFTFYLEFVKSGRRVKVQAPRDMQISSFLERFVEEAQRIFDPVPCVLLHLQEHNLLIKKDNGKFKPVRSSLTFREAGVDDGATCRLRAYIRAEYRRPYQLTLPETEEKVKAMGPIYAAYFEGWGKLRKKGLVIMDELDSISVEEA
jgi:hypothetical protein